MPGGETVTLVRDSARGDDDARRRLGEVVYDELRALAAKRLAQEPAGHMLQPTELVNQVYLRLLAANDLDVQGRTHFFAIAARQLRRVLIDRARSRPKGRRLTLYAEGLAAPQTEFDVFDLEESLQELEKVDPRAAQVVELRFFVGMTEAEAAQALNISPRTAGHDWEFAKVWLKRRMQGQEG